MEDAELVREGGVLSEPQTISLFLIRASPHTNTQSFWSSIRSRVTFCLLVCFLFLFWLLWVLGGWTYREDLREIKQEYLITCVVVWKKSLVTAAVLTNKRAIAQSAESCTQMCDKLATEEAPVMKRAVRNVRSGGMAMQLLCSVGRVSAQCLKYLCAASGECRLASTTSMPVRQSSHIGENLQARHTL